MEWQLKRYNIGRACDCSSWIAMETVPSNEITELLLNWRNGDQEALHKLIPLVHHELHRLARHYMRRENPGHTLQTTAVVNEAYCKLVDQKNVRWENRAHFFCIAAKLMRRILVDHARRRHRAKRGGGFQKISFEESGVMTETRIAELISLDDALNRLAAFDPQKSRVVEMKFFGGLSTEEIAEVEQVSPRTIQREWLKAKAWLHHAMDQAT
jgi:RNA polymerase sigma factor (TIGR02999 family)